MRSGAPLRQDPSNPGWNFQAWRVPAWRRRILLFVAWMFATFLIAKVTIQIVSLYGRYLPPDFSSEFLHGRESYFWGLYAIAFYAHIASSPAVLIAFLLQTSSWVRGKSPKLHRSLGKWTVIAILGLVAPSGLVMAVRAYAGFWSSLSFVTLSIALWICAWQGWRTALRWDWVEHEKWMLRCFALLGSAVLLRLMAGVAIWMKTESEISYIVTSWLSWTLPLLGFEIFFRYRNVFRAFASEE